MKLLQTDYLTVDAELTSWETQALPPRTGVLQPCFSSHPWALMTQMDLGMDLGNSVIVSLLSCLHYCCYITIYPQI